ncbi:MAG TPA: precorrin-4 C(11)-methyltransferase [Alphaproteobacteria bacterium]
MTVHFIGAGPGAADLITVRGRDLIRAAPVVLYAGSLVPEALIAEARKDARIIDTAAMTLEEIIAEMAAPHQSGHDVARVHSGDPSLYGAIAEQMRRLDQLGIPYDVTPGVPAFAAAAAALATELTLPGICQTVILTRTAVRASPMPPGEELAALARSGATLAIHLSINNLAAVIRDVLPSYGPECPVIVAWRVSWPDQKIIRGTLADIRDQVKTEKLTRTALILIGRTLAQPNGVHRAFADSRLYSPDHSHVLRPRRTAATPSQAVRTSRRPSAGN